MNPDRVIFAARSYTEYRRADGTAYIEKHPPKPRPKVKRDRPWWRDRK